MAAFQAALRRAERRRSPSPLRLSAAPLVLVAALLLVGGCNGKSSAPLLLDGSRPRKPAVALEAVQGPAVMTRVHEVPASAIEHGSPALSCLRGPARGARARGVVVERTGVDGETVTLRDAAGVTACDSVRRGAPRWCGSSFGRLYAGRLRDPRLDIGGCRAGGHGIAFAWIEPDADARYIGVEANGYVEVYEPAGGLPVRVSTRDVSGDGARATFHLREHDARGRLLRRVELHAVPAG